MKTTLAVPTARDLQAEVDRWVSTEFNYIQVHVVDKMCDNTLYDYIRAEEPDFEEFLNSHQLQDEFKESEQEIQEFCEDQDSFERWQDEQRDANYPMWNTLFEFRYKPTEEILQAGVDAGLGVIEGLEDFNPMLFASGCGYSFFGAHWIPMWLNLPYNTDKKEFYKDVDYSGQ